MLCNRIHRESQVRQEGLPIPDEYIFDRLSPLLLLTLLYISSFLKPCLQRLLAWYILVCSVELAYQQ